MNNIMQMLMSMGGNNPQVVLQNMLKQNPQFNSILNMMNQSGMSPKQFAEQYARQNGIDLNNIISSFNNMGIKIPF